MTAAEHTPDENPPHNGIAPKARACDGRDGLGGLERDLGAVRASVAALSQKYAKFNTRAWHMSHDLAGMRMDFSDITDDIAGISAALERIELTTTGANAEMKKMHEAIARLTSMIEKLTGN